MIFEGKHTSAPLMRVEPTGNTVRFSLMMLLTIKDGKVFEKRAHFDQKGILDQLKK